MSESLQVRWIADYFLKVAHTHGANIQNAPRDAKARKAQVSRFLTFPREDHPGDAIWIRISDKQYELPVKLTTAAVAAYNKKHGLTSDKRLTNQRYALVTIKEYKPFFGRVPLGGKGKGMSPDEHLSLEVNSIETIGLPHGSLFGEPCDLEQEEDIKAWIAGLEEGGGGGNILKLAGKFEFGESKSSAVHEQSDPKKNVADFSIRVQIDERNALTAGHNLPEVQANGEQSAHLSPAEPQASSDPLRAFRKRWKLASIWPSLIDVPEPVKLLHDRITEYGSTGVEKLPLSPSKPNREDDMTDTQERDGPHPETPSEWENSDDDGEKKSAKAVVATCASPQKGLSMTVDESREVEMAKTQADEKRTSKAPVQVKDSPQKPSWQDELSPAQRLSASGATLSDTQSSFRPSQSINNSTTILESKREQLPTSQIRQPSPDSQSERRPRDKLSGHEDMQSTSQDKENRAPRVLVPDSDTSSQFLSQSQSQSQSQSLPIAEPNPSYRSHPSSSQFPTFPTFSNGRQQVETYSQSQKHKGKTSQESSITQEASQESQLAGLVSVERNKHAELMLDEDDARTKVSLQASSDKRWELSVDAVSSGVKDSASEKLRLAVTGVQQPSPSARLGKQRRTSPDPLSGIDPHQHHGNKQVEMQADMSSPRKKLRQPAIDVDASQPPTHDSEAWSQPSFMRKSQRPAKKTSTGDARLGGHSVDLILRNLPGEKSWLNWSDTAMILAVVREKRKHGEHERR